MRKIFMRGLFTLAPICLTLALIIWLFGFLENMFSVPITAILGDNRYFPGLGVLFALVLIFIVGAFINTWMVKKLYAWGEEIVRRIPLVKTIYQSIHDVMKFFRADTPLKKARVVSIELAGTKLIGIVTREDFDDLPEGIGADEDVAVYLPMSYQIGGYMIIVPRSVLTPIDMNVDQAMRFLVTAGMLSLKRGSTPTSGSKPH